MEKNTFYVYAYLDPRKKGEFKYGNYIFEYEPFYIGKGKTSSKRKERHLYFVKNRGCDLTNNGYKFNLIKQILDENLEPIIVDVEVKLNEITAFNIEKMLIKIIGQRFNNSGSLVNISSGGDGGDTFTNNPRKEEIRQIRSKQMSGKGNNMYGLRLEEYPSHINKGEKHWNFGRKASEETLVKMSKNNSGSGNPNSKKVDKFSLNGDYICTYNTLKEAYESCGSSKTSMIRACKSNLKYTTKGFRWSYNNNKNKIIC